jgi:DNA-binding NtrC family response regulator
MTDGLSRNSKSQPVHQDDAQLVLVVDSREFVAQQLKTSIRAEGRHILVCTSARELLALFPELHPDLIITSLDLADLAGLRILQVLNERVPGVPILATIDHPSMEMGIAAAKLGVFDVLESPANPRLMNESVDRALAAAKSNQDLERIKAQIRDRHGFSHMLTQSPRMLRVFDQIRAVATTDATVLIRGETGTGKELVSRAIHERSRRRDKPFVSVNCGAFTETLLESELFGHEKGAFTGAAGRRRGVFEMADGGTLFLDELGETSLGVQVNLLRVLEEMRFRRVGGHDQVNVNVRIVAATNVNLEKAVQKGDFREDLYYRLNVFPVHLPPLRSRPEDIPLLTRHFLDDAANAYQLDAPTIEPTALEKISTYSWPGNVRQLRSLCERWVIVAHGRSVSMDLLPSEISSQKSSEMPGALSVDENLPMKSAVERTTAQVERAYLHRLLRRQHGHLSRTASTAGITRRTLYTKMKLYGLEANDYRSE